MRRAGLFVVLLAAAAALPLLACASAAPAEIRVPAPLGPAGGELRVLLPPSNAGAGPFPVVYFLHDLWGSDSGLWKHGVAQRLAARMASGDMPPFLLVAPEGHRGFWADSSDGRHLYERWVMTELPAQVAARWPVRSGPRSRAYVGISMGGAGAVRMGLRSPRETAAIVSISGLLVPLDAAFVRDARLLVRPALERVFGRHDHPDDDALRHADPYRLLGAMSAADLAAAPPLLLLAGNDDKYRLDEASDLFTRHAREKGLMVELRLAAGGHDWRYWRTVTEDAIVWAARRLAEAARS
ncbi:MAG TPA: alpha/beta hydrolase-fold protein [Thermoanaerobaculia bacterium]|jgi:S-formylglutathione hydrolase FrmB|nr:alpha/beta hydrolase-fold protein [Thermoanaerobaculia bacterium]